MSDVTDLRSLIDRRRALHVIAGLGLVALGACGSDSKTAGSTASTTAPSAGSSAAATECTTIPGETAGPYPGDGSNGPNALSENGVVRRDITSSFGSSSTKASGVPLTINLVVVDTAGGCRPISGAAVYLWHCDRLGEYSMYSQGVTGENFLRGVQPTDASGRATFTSIFPGCYPGRWPHIHFEVYPSVAKAVAGSGKLATSQIALPEATCRQAYATSGYESSLGNLAGVSLARDNVFSDDGGIHQLPSVTGSAATGYTIELTVPV